MLIPPDLLDEERRIFEQVKRGEQVDHIETIRVRKDGSLVNISLTISPVKDSDGRIVGASRIARDISRRKTNEKALHAYAQQLREADRRKDEFLAILAHELRNPLTPIRFAVEVLKHPSLSAKNFQLARQVTENQLNHMVRLVDDLLHLSRITQGKVELKKERVTLNSIVDQALETSRPHVEAAGHKLSVSLPSRNVDLYADPVRLAQVLSNLINNACKYSANNSSIAIKATVETGEVVLSVKDTGIGIAPEHLERIFELFSQIGSALERSQGGLGIGLFLVRRLVEQHGGRVEARSEGLAKGSEFIVRLPLS